jgi:hypothetical protein
MLFCGKIARTFPEANSTLFFIKGGSDAMSTFLRIMVAVGLLWVFTGAAQAVVLDPTSLQTDIGVAGDPQYPGSSGLSLGGQLVINGGGSGFSGTSDHGYFLYAELVGDGTIIARVRSFTGGTSLDREAGVMIRQSLDTGSAYVGNLILPDDFAFNKRTNAQARDTAGGDTDVFSLVGGAGVSPGVNSFVRLTRTGDLFDFAWSNDGVFWTPYAYTATVPMYGIVYVGLGVTSGDNDQDPPTQAEFRGISVTGFQTASTLYWDKMGNDLWSSQSWLDELHNPTTATPDYTTHVVLEAGNLDTVTLANDGHALSLTVDAGQIEVADNRTLTVDMGINFAAPTTLIMGRDTGLIAHGGGAISHMTDINGDLLIVTTQDLSIPNFVGNVFPDRPGTLTKQGAATLQLDNKTGVVQADYTTYLVDEGTLASKGLHPLGGAVGVILDGATLSLENTGGLIDVVGTVKVTDDSLIVMDSTHATMGALTMEAGLLTTSGSGDLKFNGSTISPGVAAVTFNTGINTALGALNLDVNPVTITKNGGANLIIRGGGSNPGSATYEIYQGGLVGVNASNPFAGAVLNLRGGNLILANDGVDDPAVFDNAVSVLANSTLTGGLGGSGAAGPPHVKLGTSGVNDVDVGGNTLAVRATDGYTLDIAGALLGTGTVDMYGPDNVIFSGGSGGATFGRVNVRGGVLTTTAPFNVGLMRIYSGTGVLNTTAELTATTLRSQGGTTNIGAVLNAPTLQVEGGAVTTNDLVHSTTITASGGSLNMIGTADATDAVVSGGTVSANQLILSNSLKQGDITYSIDTGTFTASGSDLLNGVNLAFGGNQLTVRALWRVAADSSGSGYDGDLVGGTYSSDVPAVLAGGRSADLTGGDRFVVVDTGGNQEAFNLDTITISAWVKGWPDGSWEPFVSKNGESGGYQLRARGGDGRLVFTLRGTSGDDDPNEGPVIRDDLAGQWYHIVGTYDGAERKWYVNSDDYVYTMADTGAISDTASRLVFGARDTGGATPSYGSYARVMLDDIYIYNRALNAAEVEALFTNTSIPTNGLVGKWTFDDPIPALDLPNTNLTVTDDATLVADTEVGTTLGDLDLAGGKTLTLVTQGSPISFGDVSLGDATTVLGSMAVRGELSVGSSPGVADIVGSLTLGDASTYVWDLTAAGSDLIRVSNNLMLKEGWKLQIVTDQSPKTRKLFTYGPLVFPSQPTFLYGGIDPSVRDAWQAMHLALAVDRMGNVLLVVPEPGTWMLLLTAGAFGLLAYFRRRRRAA